MATRCHPRRLRDRSPTALPHTSSATRSSTAVLSQRVLGSQHRSHCRHHACFRCATTVRRGLSAPSAMQFASMQSQPTLSQEFAVPSSAPAPPLLLTALPQIHRQWAELCHCIDVDRKACLVLFCALAGLARAVQSSLKLSEQQARLEVIAAIRQDAAYSMHASSLGRRWARVNLLFEHEIDCDWWLKLGPQPDLSERFLKDLQKNDASWVDRKADDRHQNWKDRLDEWTMKEEKAQLDQGDNGGGNQQRSTDVASTSPSPSPAKLGPSSSVTTAMIAQSSVCSESPHKRPRLTSRLACDTHSAQSFASAAAAACAPASRSSAARTSSPTTNGDNAEMADVAPATPVRHPADHGSASDNEEAASSGSAAALQSSPTEEKSELSDADADEEVGRLFNRKPRRLKAKIKPRLSQAFESELDDVPEMSAATIKATWRGDPPAGTMRKRPVLSPSTGRAETRERMARKLMGHEYTSAMQAPCSYDPESVPESWRVGLRASYINEPVADANPSAIELCCRGNDGLSEENAEVSKSLLLALEEESLQRLERFVRTIRQDQPLQCILPFDPLVESDLITSGAVRICHVPTDVATLTEHLSPEVFDPNNYVTTANGSTTRVMHFGCANNNGADIDAAMDPDTFTQMFNAQLRVSVAGEDIQLVVRRQWLYATHGLPAPVLPAFCVNRLYLKDGSENGGLRRTSRPQNDATAAASCSQSSSESIPFLPALEARLRKLLDGDSDDDAAEADHDETLDLVNETELVSETTLEPVVPSRLEWSEALEIEFHAHRERKRQQCLAVGGKGYFVHPLFLNELQLHRRSLAPLSNVDFDGVNTSYIYLKQGFQFFNLHIEQMLFTFVHEQLEGESTWFIIPFDQLDKLYRLAAEMYAVLWGKPDGATDEEMLLMGRAVLYSKQLFPPLSLLEKHHIHYNVVHLGPGQTLMAHGGFAHFGFSTEAIRTVSIATNVATESWLDYGLKFVRDHFRWIRQVKPIVCKHDAAWIHSGKQGPFKLPQQENRKSMLHGPSACFEKALNLCPSNFACAFARGLYADFDALLHGQEPVCVYPKIEAELAVGGRRKDAAEAKLHKWSSECKEIVALIHVLRPIVKEADTNACAGCANGAIDDDHSCMLCLCQSGEMYVDPRPRTVVDEEDSDESSTY